MHSVLKEKEKFIPWSYHPWNNRRLGNAKVDHPTVLSYAKSHNRKNFKTFYCIENTCISRNAMACLSCL